MNEESKQFIAHVKEELSDPQRYHDFLLECKQEWQNFIARNPQEIMELLVAKLERGAKEHGEPLYPQGKVQEELEMEFIDILGWKQVGKWSQKRNIR